MPKCLFEKSTGLFVGGTQWDDLLHNTSTHIQLELSEYPNPRIERWDDALGVRLATTQEKADFDANDPETKREAIRALLSDRKPDQTPVTWEALNKILDLLGVPRN